MNYQYFKWRLRKTWLGREWNYFDFKYLYPIRYWFSPKHKKLRNSIPKTWSDSVNLIRTVNFTFITELVEDELGGLTGLDEQINLNAKDKHINMWWLFYCDLKSKYNYITVERAKIEESLWNAYPEKPAAKDWLEWSNEPHSYEERYGKVDKIEKYLEKRDTEVLEWITKNRAGFWS